MKASLAQLARRRMAALPPGPPHPALQEAKVAFFEALVNRDHAALKAAQATMARYSRPEPPMSPAQRAAAAAKFAPRLRFLSKWVVALRERREEEARGVVFPQPTPEEEAESRALGERFARWVGGDDSAGPFEWDLP